MAVVRFLQLLAAYNMALIVVPILLLLIILFRQKIILVSFTSIHLFMMNACFNTLSTLLEQNELHWEAITRFH